MKKIIHILVALVIGGLIGMVTVDVWRNTAYIRTQGGDGTLVIEQRYSDSRWSRPLPLKKIHAYTATFSGKHQVVVESDQQLIAGQEYPIRFLTHDKTRTAPHARLRPIPGALRLRTADDPAPVKAESTEAMDRFVTTILGSPDPDHKTADAPPAATLPDMHRDSVPFLLGKATESVPLLIWNNSRAFEWIALFLTLLLFKSLLVYAWILPGRPNQPPKERQRSVHPVLRPVDPDPPPPLPKPITFDPVTPPPEPVPTPSASTSTEPVLKLPRKKPNEAKA